MAFDRRAGLLAAALVFVSVSLFQAWRDGPTIDEGIYLGSGLTALTRHDLRLTPQHPPLAKVLAAAPVLLAHPAIPRGFAWTHHDEHRYTASLIHAEQARGELRRDLFLARVVPIIESVATAFVLSWLAESLFGGGGLLVAVLWLLQPLVLGLGHLDGIDVPATLTVVAFAAALVHARRSRTTRAAVVVGLATGAAIVTRFTGLLLVPIEIVALMVLGRWRIAAALAVTVATVEAVYVALVLRIQVPPPALVRGVTKLFRIGRVPAPSFAFGHLHTGRWIVFWPLMVLAKLPPLTVALLVAAPIGWFALGADRRREVALVVGLPAAVLAVFTVQQQRPIGVRYLLPVLALGLVLAVPLLLRLPRVLVVASVGTSIVLSAWLPSLAWTNPVFGPGYRVATDSNLDWGQAFGDVASWSRGRDPWVEVFHVAGLSVDDLPSARDLRSAPPDITGWVAVSASDLTAYDRHRLAWLRAWCPVRVIDRSVLVYRFRTAPDRRQPGPDDPARPCPGGFSRLPGRVARRARTPT